MSRDHLAPFRSQLTRQRAGERLSGTTGKGVHPASESRPEEAASEARPSGSAFRNGLATIGSGYNLGQLDGLIRVYRRASAAKESHPLARVMLT
jgi:hypothetical protein